jgi:hypothetical protein
MELARIFLNQVWPPFMVFLLGLCGVLAVVALVSPKAFKAVAARGGQWVDSDRILGVLDKQVNVDDLVMRHCRVLGAAVLVAVAYLGYTFYWG